MTSRWTALYFKYYCATNRVCREERQEGSAPKLRTWCKQSQLWCGLQDQSISRISEPDFRPVVRFRRRVASGLLTAMAELQSEVKAGDADESRLHVSQATLIPQSRLRENSIGHEVEVRKQLSWPRGLIALHSKM